MDLVCLLTSVFHVEVVTVLSQFRTSTVRGAVVRVHAQAHAGVFFFYGQLIVREPKLEPGV